MPGEVSLTIVTVVRNDLSRFKKTAKSLMMQTSLQFQWVIVDGESSDGLKGYIENELELLNLDFHIRPPAGIYDAMNFGVEKCEGRFIIFLNAGDTLISPQTIRDINEKVVNDLSTDCALATRVVQVSNKYSVYAVSVPSVDYVGSYAVANVNHQGVLFGKGVFKLGSFDTNLKFASDGKFLDLIARHQRLLLSDYHLVCFEIGGTASRNYLDTLNEIESYRPSSYSPIEKMNLRFRNWAKCIFVDLENAVIFSLFAQYFFTRKSKNIKSIHNLERFEQVNPFRWPTL